MKFLPNRSKFLVEKIEWHGISAANIFRSIPERIISYLTIPSIFFLYLRSILSLYSGRISIAAKPNDELRKPDLWHSITVEVRIGTTSEMHERQT